MNDIINLLSNTVRGSLSAMERTGVGHIDLETSTTKGGYCFNYSIDGKCYSVCIEKMELEKGREE